MASKMTLSANNLKRLGAERLAELLLEISQGDVAAKKHLRAALAEAASANDLAHIVRKRMQDIARASAWVEGKKRKALQVDLERLRLLILDKIAVQAPKDALDLSWRFLALAPSVFERCADSSGRIGDVFAEARGDLSAVAQAAEPDPIALAQQAYASLIDNGYGQYDGLIGILSAALGDRGLAHLKSLFGARCTDRSLSSWERQTCIYALQDIADAKGDADAYAAHFDSDKRKVPSIAARIAERFLEANRPEDAMNALNAAVIDEDARMVEKWETVRIDVLEARGQSDDAQAARWAVFERRLDPVQLRAFLKRQPDFDDEESEREAIAYAQKYHNVHSALHFFILWPALGHAAALIEDRWAELDGNLYELLSPTADALEADHPLSTTLICRALIDYTLDKAKPTRYRHAARHLLTCERLSKLLPTDNGIEDHEAYVGELRTRHGRKSSFWDLVD